MKKPFCGVLGRDALRMLLDEGFLVKTGGLVEVKNETIDIGLSQPVRLANKPFASTGYPDMNMFGEEVGLDGLILRPGHTVLAQAAVRLNLLEPFHVGFSSRSGMARIGLESTAHVDGFGEMNCAYSRDGLSRRVIISAISRIPVTGLGKESLLQMRISRKDARLGREEVLKILVSGHNLFIDPRTGKPLEKELQLRRVTPDGRLLATLHLQEGLCGFKLRKDAKVLDLSLRGQKWEDFFEPVYANRGGDGRLYVDLRETGYYLFITREGLNLREGLCASLKQLDSSLFRGAIHFAEYFGHGFQGGATLEMVTLSSDVRAYEGSFVASFGLDRVDPDAPIYEGFSANQNLIPQLPPMVTMPTL
ncbi:MAG: hypothetical protein JWN37_51 [Candidatus Nomurabacteria bacterium]|nr:hypothetical protein [Candidatus Nomurabacteria bacterium]